MNQRELIQMRIEFEDSLRPGDEVIASWTNCYHSYNAIAKVVRVNGSSIRTEITKACGPYPVGRQITVPRFGDSRWSVNNGAFRLREAN